MADIFISYTKKDRLRVEPLANALKERGWTVWWDPIIPAGKDFDEVIEEELTKARCVIVVWTKGSVKSKYVKGEAREALNRDILVPIEVESGIKPPFDFRSIQTLSLTNWDGLDNFPEFQKLIIDVIRIIGKPPIEEEQKRKEAARIAEEKHKFDEDQKRKEEKAKIKPDKPEAKASPPYERTSSEPGKSSNVFKFGAVAGVIVLLIVGIWLLISELKKKELPPQEPRLTEGEKTAKTKNAEPTLPSKTITISLGMEFVLILAGTFIMGSPSEEPGRYDNEKQHEVTISKPFYLQTTEVTQGQWKRVMGDNPSHFKECGYDCPVERVSWDDAQKFIKRLNEKEGANKYRLPTEAEWEYACRAKTEPAYSFGDEVNKLGQFAWYADNSKGQTHPVGKKKPNDWGLYDMHCNVWEWCQDWYDKNYYGIRPVENRRGPQTGASRVVRGGSWYDGARDCRSAIRRNNAPDRHIYDLGFRLARSVALGP